MQSDASDPSHDSAEMNEGSVAPHSAEQAGEADAAHDQPSTDMTLLDLAAIEADLADVEVALARLDAGTYWTCEVTGQPLSEELMAAEPTRRRSPAV
jgi:RNA polymerase-binding transcription factor DksA